VVCNIENPIRGKDADKSLCKICWLQEMLLVHKQRKCLLRMPQFRRLIHHNNWMQWYIILKLAHHQWNTELARGSMYACFIKWTTLLVYCLSSKKQCRMFMYNISIACKFLKFSKLEKVAIKLCTMYCIHCSWLQQLIKYNMARWANCKFYSIATPSCCFQNYMAAIMSIVYTHTEIQKNNTTENDIKLAHLASK